MGNLRTVVEACQGPDAGSRFKENQVLSSWAPELGNAGSIWAFIRAHLWDWWFLVEFPNHGICNDSHQKHPTQHLDKTLRSF
jgi:hypothetical protein